MTAPPLDYDAAPISDLCRAWRDHHGWTQDQAAIAIGVSRNAWRQWEQGARTPKPETLLRRALRWHDIAMR